MRSPLASARVLRPFLLAGAVALAGHAPVSIAYPGPGRPPGTPEAAGPRNTPEQDIALLSTFDRAAREAGARLVERGDELLPALHRALLSPEANDLQRIQITTVLGEIGDPSSIGPLIAVGGAHPRQIAIRQEVLAMLAELPVTAASAAFADAVLRDSFESPLVRRKALVFFGMHRDARGRPWAERHRRDPDLELRAAALYLAARLGETDARDPILELLRLPAPPSLRYALMLGLSELATPQEFEALAPDYLRKSWEYESALRYDRFRVGDPDARMRLWREMMGSRSVFERKTGAEFAFQQLGADGLARLIEEDVPDSVRGAARHQLRRAGYRVMLTDAGVRIERRGGS